MALLKIEGFDSLVDPDDAFMTSHDTFWSIDTVVPRTGRACLKGTGNSTHYIFLPFTGTSNEIYCGFAFRFVTIPSVDNYAIWYSFGDDIGYFNLVLQTDGELIFRSNTTHKTPGSGDNKLTVDQWYYIEIKVVKSNSISAGDVQLWVDGVQWISLDAGQDTLYSTEPAYTNCIGFYGMNSAARYYDDIYICDETGAVNNTFLGPVKVATLYPTGEGNTNDFMGSDADSIDNHLHVDDMGQDADASYVESDTPGAIDLYTMDATDNVGVIHGIDALSRVKNDVIGGGSVRQGAPILRVNGTNYQGDTFNIGPPYVYKHHLLEENPDDSAAWETADLDTIEFGIKVVA